MLDVGQGDAILLEPASGDDVLVDSGPPGDGIAEMLADEGVERLALLLVTHDQLDHAGGVPDVLGSVPVDRFAYAGAGRRAARRSRSRRARRRFGSRRRGACAPAACGST